MIGIRTAIAGSLGGGGQSWASYWASQPEVLFFGLYSDIADGQMPNRKSGSSDYLTVAGTEGSETYQCPNTAPYIAADTDYIWFKTDESQRTVTTAELIGYDLQRTPVKYEDESPNEIIAIIILNAAVTGTKRDYLFRDMWLPILWDNNLNGYGHIKNNRVGQQLWTPEAVYDVATDALITRMTALSETPNSTRCGILNTAIVADKTASLWTTKYDALWLLAAHGNDSGLLNILADEFNCTVVNTPIFTTDRGYAGNGLSDALNTNYNPTINASRFVRNASSIGIYVRTNNNTGKHVFSGTDGTTTMMIAPREADGLCYYGLNGGGYGSPASVDSSGMWIVVRTSATNVNIYRNGVLFNNVTKSSTGLESFIFHLLCYNNSGTLAYFSNREISLAFVGGLLSLTDVQNIQTIWVDGYLNSIGAKV